MTSRRQPTRWAEAPAGSPEGIAASIAALQALRGSDAQVHALSERLGPQLAAPTVSGTGAWASAPLRAAVKGAGAVVASAVLVGLYVATQGNPTAGPQAPVEPPEAPARADEPPAAAPTPTLSAPTPEQAPVPTTAPAPLPAAPQRSPTATDPQPPRASRRAQPGPHDQPAPIASPNAPEAELALLKRSQAALDRDAASALALAEQHAREHPRGVFVQEREMLAIEALLKLRRRADALERAQHFRDRFPHSPHAVRVRALLERSTDP